MSEKHSPGPWVVGSCGDDVEDRDGVVVARRHWDSAQDDPTMFANMRLIAEAPAMLALLRESVHLYPRSHYSRDAAALLARIDGEPTPR